VAKAVLVTPRTVTDIELADPSLLISSALDEVDRSESVTIHQLLKCPMLRHGRLKWKGAIPVRFGVSVSG
jgi:hypothetical protein